ncbi:MAG: lipoate--protein ligase family protein [Chloroflexi bacterium]|nr:lipoate--protein ligase family protein [Chloroflexota bacterium]
MNRDTLSTSTTQPSPIYLSTTWRLLITPPLDGATNMAIDEAILHALAEGHGTPTLRFFQWEPPCLSLGYNQHWQEVDEDACQRLGYTWTRRPTGGKAILHTDELTYSLIIPQDDPRIQGGIVESYRVLSFGLLQGLENLGVQATQAAKEDITATSRSIRGGPVCFDTPSRYEITWQGKKLIGSAQLRRRKIVLQHGTLPLYGNLNRILAALNFSEEERARQAALLPQRATTLEQVLGKALCYNEVVVAMIEGFAEQLNLSLKEMPLTEAEQALAGKLRAEQYAHDSWNKRV